MINSSPEVITVEPVTVRGDEDKVFLERALEGDRLAFDRLVMKYRGQILNLCVRILGSYCDGEDAAQDTFVNAYSHLKKFRGESLVSTWLYRIAVNVCRNRQTSWWGKLQKKAFRIGHAPEGSDDDYGYEIEDKSELADEGIERKRMKNKINAAIESLPVNFRELIVLRDIQDKSYDEIADIIKVPAGTVKSRLARAREALQNKLKGVVYE
jgi:RNA polymerase sigma-70 factor, ECF subfamily